MTQVVPRPYVAAPDLGVVIAYFAPVAPAGALFPVPPSARHQRLRRTLAPLLAAGATFRLAELVFDDRAPELAPPLSVRTLRRRTRLWHKERLLMAAFRDLPATCTKVAWLDADVLFDDADWMPRASRALDDFAVIQPFSRVRQSTEATADESYARVLERDPSARRGDVFARHGHTGYAWCARRSFFETHGLYTAAIAGGADHVMAHAFTGETESACLDRVLGHMAHRHHFAHWAEGVTRFTGGRVGVLDGELVHQWHGSHEERRYVERYQALRDLDFDPERDLLDGGETWAFASGVDPRLPRFLEEYFSGRTSD